MCHELIKKLFADNQRLAMRLQEIARKKYGKQSEKLTAEQLKFVFAELQNEYPNFEITGVEPQEVKKVKVHSGGGRTITELKTILKKKSKFMS